MPVLKAEFSRRERDRRQSVSLRELRTWRSWELGRSRCPYCIDQTDEDWVAICDCFFDEDRKAEIERKLYGRRPDRAD